MKNVLKIKNPSTGEFEPIAAISGADGQGVPIGGTTGQILRKTGNGNYETEWNDKAEDSEKLGGVAAAQYALKNGVPAHNLLDNSDFTNPVNQRGASAYGGSYYGIDRWYGNTPNQELQVRASDIAVFAGSAAFCGIRQKVGRIASLAGKTVTFAAQVYSNVSPRIAFLDASNNSLAQKDGIAATNQTLILTYTVPSDATADSVVPIIVARTQAAGDYIGIYWAALYEGSYTADTLPAYQPKGYAAELAECQRYFIRVSNSAAYGVINGTSCVVQVPLPMTMRKDIVPTATLDSAVWAYTHEGYVGLTFIGTMYSTNTANLHFTLGTETSARCCVVPDLSFNISADL